MSWFEILLPRQLERKVPIKKVLCLKDCGLNARAVMQFFTTQNWREISVSVQNASITCVFRLEHGWICFWMRKDARKSARTLSQSTLKIQGY